MIVIIIPLSRDVKKGTSTKSTGESSNPSPSKRGLWRLSPWAEINPCLLGKKPAVLRVIPTLTNCSRIVSDISSGSMYGIYYRYILTFYLVFFLAYTLTFFPAYIRTFFLWHLFGRGIYSDILLDVSSIWHDIWHVFGSRCGPQHPELAMRRSVQACPALLKSGDPHLAGGEPNKTCSLGCLTPQIKNKLKHSSHVYIYIYI